MSYLLTVSGSPHPASKNSRLLAALSHLTDIPVRSSLSCDSLPLFQPALDHAPLPTPVVEWRSQWSDAFAVVISTPAYLHNMPAVLKNGLEWLTTTGEAVGKPVLALTFCPQPPRGARAMESLLWSLGALDARVVAQLPCYQSEIGFLENGDLAEGDTREILVEALKLLS